MRRFKLLLLTTLFLAACRSSKTTTVAPDFALKDLSGRTVQLSSFKGKPVLLDFWATWCGPCLISIPYVDAFYQKNKSSGLVILSINTDETPEDVPPVVERLGMTYPVLLGGTTDISYRYNITGIPAFVLIAPNGNVHRVFSGFHPKMFQIIESDMQDFKRPST